MKRSTKKRIVAIGAMAFSLPVAATSIVQLAAGDSQSCVEAQAWAKSHATALPRKYAEIQSFPVDYRKAIFTRLTSEEQAKYWQDHFEAFAKAQSSLTTAQRAIVSRASALMTPDYCRAAAAKGMEPQRWKTVGVEPMERLAKDALNVFSNEQLHELLDGSEATARPYSTVQSAMVNLREQVRTAASQFPFSVLAAGKRCSCNEGLGNYDCPANDHAESCLGFPDNEGGCWHSAVGCGPSWLFECDGLCPVVS